MGFSNFGGFIVPVKRIVKAATVIGTVTAALIGLGVVGVGISEFMDPIVLTLAEGDDRYVQQKDYVVYEEKDDIAELDDDIDEVNKNVRILEGAIRASELEISRDRDVDWNQDEILRLEEAKAEEHARREKLEQRIETKEEFIACVEADGEHCATNGE